MNTLRLLKTSPTLSVALQKYLDEISIKKIV